MAVQGRRGWLGRAILAIAALAAGLAPVHGAPPAAAAPPAGDARPLRVVATTGMLGDVAREIAGPRARVRTLMGEGVDPHLYKASPGDVRAMADADLILYNGLHLEGRMADVIVRMAGRRTVVQATDAVDESRLREPPEFEGQVDPHLWFDVALWTAVARRIGEALAERDPAGAAEYRARTAEYAALLGELDAYARATLATVPAERRLLVTAHDAFGYFGAAYGLEVMAIQGISTDSEASLQDINALVDTLVARRVPAVFVESSVPRKTVDALVEGCRGRGHSIVVGGELFSDAMGAEGTLGGTYVGMVLHNVDTVARALGGSIPATKPGRLAEYVARHTPSPGAGNE